MTRLIKRLACTATLTLGLLTAFAANARYVVDTAAAPNGTIDLRLYGDATLSFTALYPSVSGDELVTLAQQENVLAVCAFTTAATSVNSFGTNGCYRETLPLNETIRQLLVGKNAYWLFITDNDKPQRFSLLRLTRQGQPDTTYGTQGRRSFDLACDASDNPAHCPEAFPSPRSPYASNGLVLAETGDEKLWVLAARRNDAGAREGVILQIDRGRSINARANFFDALPPAWIAGQQANTHPISVVAHGTGVLVEHKTSRGFAVVRVAANGAIDRSFAASQPDGLLLAGDGALPDFLFQRPVVASDQSFFWGLTPTAPERTRYAPNGATLGTLALPSGPQARVLAAPASFSSASVAVWMSDGARIGLWQNGQWDASAFGGQGTFQPEQPSSLFALSRDGSTLAVVAPKNGSPGRQLGMLATRSRPQVLSAAAPVQPDSALDSPGSASGINAGRLVLYAAQADGLIRWKQVTLDPRSRAAPVIITGTLPALPGGNSGDLLLSDANAAGQRWAVRSQQNTHLEPQTFYAQRLDPNAPVRRINLDAIRAQMPAFIPVTPFSNPHFLNIDTADDGSARALIQYAHGSARTFLIRLALLRWDSQASTNNEYLPQTVWTVDSESYPGVQRDAQNRLLLTDRSSMQARRITPQGTLDTSFAQAGILDLTASGFTAEEGFIFQLAPDGSAWIGSTTRLLHVADNGQILARVLLPSQGAAYTASALRELLADAEGGVRVHLGMIESADTYRMLRYTSSGELDTSFGLRGAETLTGNRSELFTPSFVPWANDGLAALSGSSLRLFRHDPSQPGASGATVPVVEFHNSLLNHYFMTADPGEIANIETGGAGGGWSRTGESFAAYPELLNAPGDARTICRFYGSSWPAPASPNGRIGPNSHFYTFAGEECNQLYRNDHAWIYEGVRLALLPLQGDNTCASGQKTVYRVYNNGYQTRAGVWTKNDSNHRYSTSQAIIAEMVGKGWINEGARFCAP